MIQRTIQVKACKHITRAHSHSQGKTLQSWFFLHQFSYNDFWFDKSISKGETHHKWWKNCHCDQFQQIWRTLAVNIFYHKSFQNQIGQKFWIPVYDSGEILEKYALSHQINKLNHSWDTMKPCLYLEERCKYAPL